MHHQVLFNFKDKDKEKGERATQETVTASIKPVISSSAKVSQRKSTAVQPQAHIQVFSQTKSIF